MVFTSPSWVPKLRDPPDTVPIHEFMFDEKHGRYPIHKSKPPFTCGLTGAEYSAVEVRERINNLAKALSKELNWQPNSGTEWDKVIGVFTVNTVGGHCYVGEQRAYLITVEIDRYTHTCMGNSSSQRDFVSCKRGIFCGRARVSIEQLRVKSTFYMRTSATHSLRGCIKIKHT